MHKLFSQIRPKLYLAILLFFITPSLSAQNIQLEGDIKDSIHKPILGANMIAKPLQEGQSIAFAISNHNGRYKLQLAKDVPYTLSITSIGYTTITDTIQLAKSLDKDFIMLASKEQLDEVVVRAKMAMIVKKDTITYRPDTFISGNERKLREMLEKLPGVEVDREGNVKVYGKEVTDLLVDGKSFFGGDTKLGVNNIPADVVDEVEVIDDYQEVSFMKGLQRSERMAMNIKLKEGKNRFLFGETQAGGGTEDRYYIHPTIFYYSPETTLNFIGSLNNVNESPLSMQDVMRFRGGYSSFTDSPINTFDSNLYQFASNPDILHKKTLFGAANITHKLSNSLNIEAYSIVNQQRSNALNTSEIVYLTQDNLVENREDLRKNKGLSTINNIKLRYQPNMATDVAYTIVADYTDADNTQNITSLLTTEDNNIYTNNNPDNFEISQNLRWSIQPKYEHTSEINANHSFKKGNSLTDWVFDKPLFSDIIPSVDEGDAYNFLQDYTSTTHTGQVEYKHYWVLNNTNHLYPFVGLHFYNQSYKTTDFQVLNDGTENSFSDAGFNNDLDYQLIDPYLGFEYKFMLGSFIFKPGITYHQYYWQAKQFGDKLVDKNKGVWLPVLNVEFEVNSVNKIVLDYSMNSTFKDAAEYANRYRLNSFNQLYRGNIDLENETYHSSTLYYRNTNILNRIYYNLGFSYIKREKSIRNTTVLEGIDQISTSVYSNLPENNYSFNGSFSKSFSDFVLGTGVNAGLSDYSRIINEEQIDYKNQNFSYRLQATYRKKNAPYVRLLWTQRFNNSQSETYKSKYLTTEPSVELEYNFLKDFVFKADYTYTYSKEKTINQKETYQLAGASLYYNKRNSLWGFEIRAENLFDLNHKRIHSMDQFMVYDQWVYIQPRTVLFIVSYKL